MARGGDGAGTGEIDEGRAEIDNEETEHPEHDRCIGKAHQPSGRAPAAFNRIGNVGIEAVDLDVLRAGSSNPSPQEGATNARRYEVIVPRRGEHNFRGVRKEPGAFEIDALIEGKDQRCPESKETDRSIEHGERKRHVENRNPEQHDIDTCEKQRGIGGAEQQHDVNEIERQAERGNKIEDNEVEPLKRVRQALEPMEKAQLAIHHETNSQGVAIPARALAQKAYGPGRAISFRPSVRHETDEVTKAAQPQAVLKILSRTDVQTALPHEHIASIHGTGAGQTGDRFDDVQYGSPRTDRHQVLDALQSGP